MKVKEFFKQINTQGKIATNEDFTKFVDALPESDVPDLWKNLFDDNFLTRERAQADPKLYDIIRGEVLDGVKVNIKEILPLLDPKDAEDIAKNPKGFDQVKMLKTAVSNRIEKIKAENPSNDDKVKDLQKVNQDLVDKFNSAKTEFENKEKETKSQFAARENDLKLNWTLEKKMSDYVFADEYKDLRQQIVDLTIGKIKGENVLLLSEDGQIQVHEKLESGATKQKFNGNTAVTLDNLLVEPLGKFLKKNNGGSPPANGSQGRATPPPIQTQTPRNKQTLAEMRADGVKAALATQG